MDVENLPKMILSLKLSNSNISKLAEFPQFHQFVALILNSSDQELKSSICQLYIAKFIDFGSAFFGVAKTLKNLDIQALFQFLKVVTFEGDDENLLLMYKSKKGDENLETIKKKVKVSNEFYRSVQMKDDLTIEEYKTLRTQNYSDFIMGIVDQIKNDKVLIVQFFKLLSKFIVDKLENPLIISNFIQHHFDKTDQIEIKIQALQTLFVLIGKYQFNYDNLYEKFEEILQHPSIFETEETPKFLKLLFISCKSSKVPQVQLYRIIKVYNLPAILFIKIVLRRSLLLRPYRQFWAVCFVFNIIKKNQTLRKFLQRKEGDPIMDNFTEKDFELDNCYFWELLNYKGHWSSQIREVISMLGDDLSEYDYYDLEAISELDEDQYMEMSLLKIKQ